MRGYWDGSTKDNGRSGCGLVIEAVDREEREIAGASKKLVLRTYCWTKISIWQTAKKSSEKILNATKTEDNKKEDKEQCEHLFADAICPFGRRRRARAKQGSLPQRRRMHEQTVFFRRKNRCAAACSSFLNAEETSTRDKILTQVWTSYVKDALDVTHVIQTKAEFVMDRIGDCIEPRRNGGKSKIGGWLGASMWIYTKAAICTAQHQMDVSQ